MIVQDNMLSADDLMKSYVMGSGETENIVHALNGVSLSIHSGEMVAIRGPSGSGKTTLMNILGCLDRPSSGRYVLAGSDVSRMNNNSLAAVRNKKIGFVFQTFNLLPRMNALENVELPLLYGGAANAKKKALEALTIVGLGERSHHRPNQLSGGQKQRVSIARAIVTDPAIVLADEPTGALDTRTGEEILALFKQLNSQGRTIIIVTHDLKVAGHCQREIYMRDGRIAEPDIAAVRPGSVPESTAVSVSLAVPLSDSQAAPAAGWSAIAPPEPPIEKKSFSSGFVLIAIGVLLIISVGVMNYFLPFDGPNGGKLTLGYLAMFAIGGLIARLGIVSIGKTAKYNKTGSSV